MTSFTERFTEVNQPGGELYPALKTATAHAGAWIRMSSHQRVVFLVQIGAMTALSTVDFSVQQDDVGDGSNAKAITGKSITQLTQAGGDGNDLIAVEVRTEELDVSGGFHYVRGLLTVGTDTVYAAVLPLRFIPNYPPVATTGWTEVVD